MRVNSCVRLRGCSGFPSSRAHTRVSPVCPTPSSRRSSACFVLLRFSSSTAKDGRVIARALCPSLEPLTGSPLLSAPDFPPHGPCPPTDLHFSSEDRRSHHGAFRSIVRGALE